MPKKILVVDDSPSIRSLLSVYLTGQGYAVDEASGGRSALEKARQNTYALIVTDQNMPGMEGLDLVQNLREMPGYQKIPILVLTTETADEMKASFKAAGASAWMSKPFAPERMAAALAKLLPDGP